MAYYLHERIYLGHEQAVGVEIDRQARVMLMNDTQYQIYRNNGKPRAFGGWAKQTPIYLKPPTAGYYNLVIDFEGAAGNIKHKYWIQEC